ncbi:serine/threonine-protein phosphatase 4 regulatory subunit 4 isoform X4 [Strongylocentrotus purpuratus]|uniref:Serine/threonine-protein phosphatase 4 regulatory subunit 4 n=1 Tax=Strongylocentrotus purpuratus TaxID=7668 RepID=A0A7M7HMT5_STRPU|nr:serine/threonine-protein phosphatase 4 regulatory subunit 4 isoform X4 [Strongylocentrotus purpuratus]
MDWGESGQVDELESGFSELGLEKSITSGLKTAEEIESLTVDEHLGDIDRAVFLLSSGQEVQRISVIQNLPNLLRDNNVDAMRRVVPKVRDVLHLANQDLQEAAAAAFVKIAEEQSVPHLTYAQTFLQTILQNADNRDPDISDAWLDVLLKVIAHLPKDVLKKDILPVALSKGQLAQSVQSRLASCRLLGKIATRFDTFMIKKEILPLVTSLCQDVDYEVRACMCKQLDRVARGLGLEPTRSAILPELVELGKDEESCVRLAALETIVSLLSLLDDVNFIPPDTCTQTIIPLVRKFCENAMNNEDSTLPSVAKQFGRLCHGLSVNLTEELKLWFLKYYYQLCSVGLNEKSISNDRLEQSGASCNTSSTKNSPMLSMYREEHRLTECRQFSAFNFPCMVLFAGARKFKAELHGTFASLCDDPQPQVRATLACGFHEVAHLLGNNVSCIHGELVSLLKDENLQVVQGIVSHLPETLIAFSKGAPSSSSHQVDNKVYGVGDLIPAILAAESIAANSRNWRLHVDILDKLACLPKCLTSDQIHSKFVPLFFKLVTTHRALPIQRAASRTLCALMRNCRKLDHRQDMVAKLIHECCRSKSSRYRRLYIDISVIVMDMFSKSFFKENFMEPLMDLTADPVPNIRLKMCSLLPRIKHQMKLPEDRENLQALEMVVRRLLSSEKDKDVDAAIRQAVFELDRIQVHVDSLNMSQYYEDDIQDRKKEAEERAMLEIERRNIDDGAEKGSREKGPARHTEKKKAGAEKESKVEKNVHAHSQSNPASAPSISSRKVSKSNSHKHISTPSGSKSSVSNGPPTGKNITVSSSSKSSVSNGPPTGKNIAVSSSSKSSVSNGPPTGKNSAVSSSSKSSVSNGPPTGKNSAVSSSSKSSVSNGPPTGKNSAVSSSSKSSVSNGPPSGKHNTPSSSRKVSPPQGAPMNSANRAKTASKAQKASKTEVVSAPLSRTAARAGKKSPSATLLEPNNNVKATTSRNRSGSDGLLATSMMRNTRTTRVVEYNSSLSSPTASSAAKRTTSGTHVSESRKSSASSVSSTRSGTGNSSYSHLSTSSSSTRVRKSSHKT